MKPIEEAEIHIVDDVSQCMDFMRWLGERRDWLAFDTETGGLEWWKQPMRLFQLGDQDTAWVFRADRWMGVLCETLNRYEGRIVGHNLPFDVRFYEKATGEKFPWHNAHDSMVMAHILNPDKSKALKTVGAQFLGPQARKLQGALAGAMKAQGWGWDTIPLDFPIYTGYAGVDCILTSRIASEFWPQIQAEYQAVYDLEIQVSRICSEMEVRGVSIDLSYVHQKYEELTQYCNEIEVWCRDNYRVLPSENQTVAAALKAEGVDLYKTTATGLWSMDKDALEGIDHPLAKAVLGHRKASKIRSTYFGNAISMHERGVLHPSIYTLGAETGRMSIQQPALQTLPRGRIVRDAFIPFAGQVMYSVDYAGVEARLFAHFANEEALIKVFHEGFDPHTYAAQQVFGVEEPTKAQRQTAKACTFALLFGAGPEKVGITAGISTEEAEAFLDNYKKRFQGVPVFMKTVERVANARAMEGNKGYVKTPLGRRQVAVKDKHYTLVNKLIQGTAADVLKRALVDLDNAGFGPYMLLPIHDEILFSLPEDVPVQEIIATMEDRQSFRVPLVCESSGPYDRWGEKYGRREISEGADASQ